MVEKLTLYVTIKTYTLRQTDKLTKCKTLLLYFCKFIIVDTV